MPAVLKWRLLLLALPLVPYLAVGVLAFSAAAVLLPAAGLSGDAEYRPWELSAEGIPAKGGGELLEPREGAPLAFPVRDGAVLASGFGWRRHPLLGTQRFHTGIDLAAPQGTEVLAAADGVVAFAGRAGGYGITVVISHGGWSTRYAHLFAALVLPGQAVGRGQAVGLVGSTGLSTGPHLHFEVKVGGLAVDPRLYF